MPRLEVIQASSLFISGITKSLGALEKMTSTTSLRETLSLAHTAQCKLHLAANRADRNLRFVLGHALTLDTLTLRLVEIEEETAAIKQPTHSSDVRFKAAGNGGSTTRKRSPPPNRLAEMTISDEDDEDDDDDDISSESDQDELALTRFPSGSAKPPAQPVHRPPPATSSEPPPLDPSDDSSDEEADEAVSPKAPSEDTLRHITKGNGDELLMNLYSSIKKCPCHGHHESGPEVQRMWEVPAGEGETRADGVRIAVAEVLA